MASKERQILLSVPEETTDAEAGAVEPRPKGKRWTTISKKVRSNSFYGQYGSMDETEDSDKPEPSQKNWSDFKLQEDLKGSECITLVTLLVLVGTVAFCFFERWSILDSLYFTVVLLTTVGYGDICPISPGGKIFASIFALTGVALLGMVLGVMGSQLVEKEMHLLDTIEKELADEVESAFLNGKDDASITIDSNHESSKLLISNQIEKFRPMIKILWRYMPVLTIGFGGAVLIGLVANWAWYDIIYFFVVTATTVGFGDLTPENSDMKIFAIFFLPFAVAVMGYILGEIVQAILDKRRERQEKNLWTVNITAQDLKAIDSDGDGEVNELEYVKFMLVAMNKVDAKMFADLHRQFTLIDATGDGTISIEDLKMLTKKKMGAVKHKLSLQNYKKKVLRLGNSVVMTEV